MTESDGTAPPRSLAPLGATLESVVPPEELAARVCRNLEDVFEVEGALGDGAMGKVVAARDKNLGRVVAIKVLLPELRGNPSALRRFVTEAQVAAQLEHPNIVPVYGFESENGSPAFAMRLLPGKSLDDLLSRARKAIKSNSIDETVSLEARLEIFLSVCDAIAYAHARGVVHRDLKPENVVLGEHGDVYVVDWGIAKVIGVAEPEPIAVAEPARDDTPATPSDTPGPSQGEKKLGSGSERVKVTSTSGTRAGDVIGTPNYMPPEQAVGKVDEQSAASDQFSLGMMLQELVTLVPARPGEQFMPLLAAALQAKREPFERDADGAPAPPELVAIVERATRREPRERYPDVTALAADVRRFVRGNAVSVLPDGPLRKLTRRVQKRPGIFVATVAAFVAALASFVSFELYRSLGEEQRTNARATRLSGLTGNVLEHSRTIDARFGAVYALTEGLGASIEAMLAHEGAGKPPSGWGAAGRLVAEGPALVDRAQNDRYRMPVSWKTPAFLYPPGVSREAVTPEWSRLDGARALFAETMARSGDGEATTWTYARTVEYLARTRPPIHVVYVGLESGLLLNYPGYEPFPDAYDPRKRPWYQVASQRAGSAFGDPYPDASGSAILVPCNRTVRSATGALLGVAGADMALDDVAAAMSFADIEGWARTELVDKGGRVVLGTEQAGLRLGVGLHGDTALDTHPLEPDLAAAIASGTGWTKSGDHIVVFHRLVSIPWTLVARFDAARWL